MTARETGTAPTGGGSGPGTDVTTPGVRPRAGRACAVPRLARRMDRRPPPRLRALRAGRTGARAREDPTHTTPTGLDTPAWDAALDAARGQVGPVALRVLSAVAEVLDGRRPVEHLAAVCPEGALPAVTARVLAARRPGTRGTRVRGLRMCPLVTAGPHPVLAVEVAAALCAPAGPAAAPGRAGAAPPPGRARAVAARFELHDGAWRLIALVVG